MKIVSTICAFSLALGFAVAQTAEPKKEETKTPPAPPAAEKKDSPAAKEVAVIKTSMGEMVIEFWPDVAPKTVENFKTLARKGFYDGTAFHRVIQNFMIQGGDPLTKDPAQEARWGNGDPGYKIDAEFSDRHHVRGVVSMARGGDPMERYGRAPRPQFANSAGSQFFICHADAPHLDGKYTAFGKLIKGEDVLDKIAATPVTPDRNKPITRVEVQTIKIVAADSVQ